MLSYVTESVPARLQMFDNISKLQFVQGPGGESIANAMISSEGEMMEYKKGVLAEGKVHIHTRTATTLSSISPYVSLLCSKLTRPQVSHNLLILRFSVTGHSVIGV